MIAVESLNGNWKTISRSFIQVTIDRHPVRFFVHKRPHVDFFLDVVSENEKGTESEALKEFFA